MTIYFNLVKQCGGKYDYGKESFVQLHEKPFYFRHEFFRFKEGNLWLLGPSGAGKSTLQKILMGTLRMTVPVEIVCFVPAILHLFQITPAWLRYYPMNVCMDMISGRSVSTMGIFNVMAAAKLSMLTVFGAAIPFFLRSNLQYFLSPLPSFWIGKAVLQDQCH